MLTVDSKSGQSFHHRMMMTAQNSLMEFSEIWTVTVTLAQVRCRATISKVCSPGISRSSNFSSNSNSINNLIHRCTRCVINNSDHTVPIIITLRAKSHQTCFKKSKEKIKSRLPILWAKTLLWFLMAVTLSLTAEYRLRTQLTITTISTLLAKTLIHLKLLLATMKLNVTSQRSTPTKG